MIHPGQCPEWVLRDGELRHTSNRFFQVCGRTVHSGAFTGFSQVMLRQEEVGLLGFLARPGPFGLEWLLQAKTEPGNVGGTQLAPTVQATLSNQEQVHGGAATTFLEFFAQGPDQAPAIGTATCSEQGTRFVGKLNDNQLRLLPADDSTAPPGWLWADTPSIRAALGRDFTVNTDARSVLVCTADEFFRVAQESLQAGSATTWDRLTLESWSQPEGDAMDVAMQQLASPRPPEVHIAPVEGLANGCVEQWVGEVQGPSPQIRMYSVEATDREVPRWCQPLMVSRGLGRVALLATRMRGMLHVLLRTTWEPGFGRAELAPSFQSDTPNLPEITASLESGRVRLSSRQSDEGGRFMQSITLYQVIEIPTAIDPPGCSWVTVGQAFTMAAAGLLTNEARSALSLFLAAPRTTEYAGQPKRPEM